MILGVRGKSSDLKKNSEKAFPSENILFEKQMSLSSEFY